MRTIGLIILVLGIGISAITTAQTVHTDPDRVTEELFWGELYAEGGKTLYCQADFGPSAILTTISNIYDLSWARDELRCLTARSCLRNNETYQKIASDLHNMFPVRSTFEMSRGGDRYGEVGPGASEGECGERTTYRNLEPPDHAKGPVARAMLYMHATYELTLRGDMATLQAWNRQFPPTEEEVRRNQIIRELQGNANPFISDPTLSDDLI